MRAGSLGLTLLHPCVLSCQCWSGQGAAVFPQGFLETDITIPWKAFILHRVLFLVIWAKAKESVFKKVLWMVMRVRSVWKALLWPPN